MKNGPHTQILIKYLQREKQKEPKTASAASYLVMFFFLIIFIAFIMTQFCDIDPRVSIIFH